MSNSTAAPSVDLVRALGRLLPGEEDATVYDIATELTVFFDRRATPAPGSNSGAVDLSLLLDPDLLQRAIIEQHGVLLTRRDALMESVGKFKNLTADGIADDDTQGRADVLRNQLTGHAKKIDDARVLVKEPVLKAARAIDGLMNGWAKPLTEAVELVRSRMTTYTKAKADAERARMAAEAKAAAAKAERLARAAAAAAPTAPEVADAAMDAALEADQRAADMAAAARTASSAELSRVRSDLGTTSSLRRTLKVRLVDATKVPADYLLLNEPLAIAFGRAKMGKDKAIVQAIPGVEFYYEEKI